MKVLLLENVRSLGVAGDLVDVRGGFARNYLFIKKKAARFTKKNKEDIERRKDIIRKRSIESKRLDLQNSKAIDQQTLIMYKKCVEDGILYGSVTDKDVVDILYSKFDISINTTNVIISDKIKKVGVHTITIKFSDEIKSRLHLNVVSDTKRNKKE